MSHKSHKTFEFSEKFWWIFASPWSSFLLQNLSVQNLHLYLYLIVFNLVVSGWLTRIWKTKFFLYGWKPYHRRYIKMVWNPNVRFCVQWVIFPDEILCHTSHKLGYRVLWGSLLAIFKICFLITDIVTQIIRVYFYTSVKKFVASNVYWTLESLATFVEFETLNKPMRIFQVLH